MRRIVVALLLLVAVPLRAAPGDLDPTFGGGYVQRDFAGEEDLPQGMTALASGGTAIVGRTLGTGGFEFAVARYTAEGALDPAFGGDGLVTTPFGDGATAFAVAEQAGGKLVVVGTGGTGVAKDFVVVRYEADGDPDPTFGGGDGIATFDLAGHDDEAHAVIAEPGGTILVVGWSVDAGFKEVFALIRLDDEGDLASSWGGDGIVTADFTNGAKAFAAVRRASDGAIVAAGRTTFLSDDVAVARFESDGDPDPTFSTDGFVTADFGGNDGAVAVVLDGDAIVAVGDTMAGDTDVAVARWEGDGDPDAAFGGGDGLVTGDVGPSTTVTAGTRLADGRIVALAQSATGLGLVLVRFETDGDLDGTFGTGGVVQPFRLTQPAGVIPNGTDGLLVATGFIAGGGSGDFVLARFDGAGALDRAFGEHGRFLLAQSNAGFDEANGVAVQADGKIVVAGTLAGIQSVVARFDTTGALDPTFGGGDGLATFNLGVLQNLHAVLLLPGGGIAAAGFADQSIVVLQLESDGDPDPSFGGGDGIATNDLDGVGGVGAAIARQPDGKLVVAGTRGTYPTRDMVVARFVENGDVDAGFGTGGFRAIDLGGESDGATAVLVDPDGNVVLAGLVGTEVGIAEIEEDMAVARVDASGTPDPGFGTGGVTTIEFDGMQDRAFDIVRQASGRLVVAGRAGTIPLFTFALAGLTPGGALDDTFGTGGKVVTDFPDGEDVATTILETPDGRLLVGGFGDDANDVPGFELARYGADGVLDDSFGTDGHVVTSFFSVDAFLAATALAPDGTLVAVGQGPYSNSNGVFALARYVVEGGTPSTTTTTLPGQGEDCGNCVDDDGDGLTDYEDPSCCTGDARTLTLKRAVMKPSGAATKLTLRGTIGGGAIAATTTGLVLQLRPAGGDELYCARVPAASFKAKKKTSRFVDKAGTVAGGLGKITLKAKKTGAVTAVVVGKRAAFATPAAGPIAVTIAGSDGRCASATATFRAKKKGVITAP